MQATPATWRMLLAAGWQGDDELKALCGGEAVSRDLVGNLVSRSREVWNLYGPTETTIWSSRSRLRPGTPITIGRPVANTTFYVVDEHLQLVPPGVPGELLIGGDSLARGYHGRPELTAEKFMANPFGAGRLYRTGDLVRYRLDGCVEYLNRLDDQVKLNGYRIELGEIEHRLCQHAAIHRAVVIIREGTLGDRWLTAYVQLRDTTASPPAADIQRYLKTLLPDYMVPTDFAFVEYIPFTPNGKVDRKRLMQLKAPILFH